LFATTRIGFRALRRIPAISSSPGVTPVRASTNEEDEVGLLYRTLRLLGDVLGEGRGVGNVHATGVDEDEALPRPLADHLFPVARHPRGLEHDSLARRG
jgi:hypothetical protein